MKLAELEEIPENEAWNYDRVTEGLHRYIDENENDQKWVTITEIVVPSQEDKDQLLKAFEYIHNLRTIDTDFLAVNTIIHMYETPERIKVKNSQEK